MGGVEDREHSEQMRGVVHRHTAQLHNVVRVVATLDVGAAAKLGVGLHAGQHLREVHRVGVAEYLRHIHKALHLPHHHAVSTLRHARRVAPRTHHYAIKRNAPHTVLLLRMAEAGQYAEHYY